MRLLPFSIAVLIEQMLEAARWAPSAGNSQPWEFLVIRNEETRERIVEIFKTQNVDGRMAKVQAGVLGVGEVTPLRWKG